MTRQLIWVILYCVVLTNCATTSKNDKNTTPRQDPLRMVSAADLFHQGLALSEQGDLVRAEQYFLASLSKGHPETKVVPKLIELCLVASRYRAALQYAEPFLERHPTDAHLRTVVGSVHLALGEYAMARSALEEAVRTDSNQKFAYYLLGVIARDHDHAVTPARDRFTKYLNLEPLGRHASEARAYLAETENMRPLHSQNRRERKAL